uniref:Uncharacterized protein n=1 Tax=Meloidogyne hapla TaxID=6305 RepID=A0A1I8BJU7_MELHA
ALRMALFPEQKFIYEL